ncbi:MAG: undecaprenyl-diphosphate phosphatase [Thermoanaerobaculia bacterium]
MTSLEALLLGALQGATEFLPVSSSGHLALAQHFLGVEGPQVAFDVVLHVATLLAVVVVYRRDLTVLVRAVVRGITTGPFWRSPRAAVRDSPELALALALVLGSIPTAVIGLLFQDPLEALFERPAVVAVMLLVTGAVLQLPRLVSRGGEGRERVGALTAVVVGTAQGLAITPGISRSGSTISAALVAGVAPAAAARFSFLLSIPAILGALVLKLPDLSGAAAAPRPLLVLGFVTAFAVGWACLVALLALLRRGRFAVFSWYCWAVGLAALVALAL